MLRIVQRQSRGPQASGDQLYANGVVVLADTASEARYVQTQRYSQKSLDNKRAYADHHGYELIVHEPAATLPAPWDVDAVYLRYPTAYDECLNTN